MAGDFPGNRETEALDEDEEARERFCAEFEGPLPGAGSVKRAYLLYAFRPLSCRSYRLPVLAGGEILPPCPLNFQGASEAEIASSTIAPTGRIRRGRLSRSRSIVRAAGTAPNECGARSRSFARATGSPPNLGRMALYRHHGVDADWDGTFALDHK